MASVFRSKRAMATNSAVRAGRPTRQQAQERQVRLLEIAFEHFLEKGFEQATIEAIAADVSMTKRTVYARYPDKAALFLAAVRRGTEMFAPPPERIAATRKPDLVATLEAIAHLRIDLISQPDGLKLQRVIDTESYRFPHIFSDYYDIAVKPTVLFLSQVLAEESAAGRLSIEDTIEASNLFMGMAVTAPVRFITAGMALDQARVDTHVSRAVRFFLDGALPR